MCHRTLGLVFGERLIAVEGDSALGAHTESWESLASSSYLFNMRKRCLLPLKHMNSIIKTFINFS